MLKIQAKPWLWLRGRGRRHRRGDARNEEGSEASEARTQGVDNTPSAPVAGSGGRVLQRRRHIHVHEEKSFSSDPALARLRHRSLRQVERPTPHGVRVDQSPEEDRHLQGEEVKGLTVFSA